MVKKILALAVMLLVAFGAAPAFAQYEPNSMTLDRIQTTPGGQFSLFGGYYAPGSDVRIDFNSTPVTLGTIVASAEGTITGTFSTPAGATLGAHTVTATGTGLDGQPLTLSAAIQVVASAANPTTVTPTTGSLPTTGSSNTGLLVAGGAALLAVGGIFLVTSRRAHRQATVPVER